MLFSLDSVFFFFNLVPLSIILIQLGPFFKKMKQFGPSQIRYQISN